MTLIFVVKVGLQTQRFPQENLDSSDVGHNKDEQSIWAELGVVNLDGFVVFGYKLFGCMNTLTKIIAGFQRP